MASTQDDMIADLQRAIAEQRRELSERDAALARRASDYGEGLAHQAATVDVLKAMSASPGDPQPVFDLIVERARDICGSYGVSLFEFDGSLIHLRAWNGVSDDPAVRAAYVARFPHRPSREFMDGRIILDREVTYIRDTRSEPGLTASVRSAVGVPLLRGGAVIGAIGLGSLEVAGFSDAQIELLKTFAEQAVIAITSAETYEALQERTRHLQESLEYQTATSDVLKVISRSTFDLDPVLEAVAETAARLCDSDQAMISRYEDGVMWLGANVGFPPEYEAHVRSRGRMPVSDDNPSVSSRAHREGRVVHIEDVTTVPGYSRVAIELGKQRTSLGVPLLREGQAIGCIVLARQRVEPFSERQIELVRTFADQAVIAIENTRLMTEQREALEQQTAAAEVLQVINASPGDLTPVFEAMLDKAMRLCGVAFGMLRAYDGEHFHPLAARGLPEVYAKFVSGQTASPGRGTAMARALETGLPMQEVDIREEEGYKNGAAGMRAIVELAGGRTVLHVPLIKDRISIGFFTFFRQEVRAFSDKEIALLENFAAQAVIAMENARLLTEQKEALEQQTATAEVLQAINASPGDLAPVFQTMLDRALRLCGASFGELSKIDGDITTTVAVAGMPAAFSQVRIGSQLRPGPGTASWRFRHGENIVHIPDLVETEAYRDGDPVRRALVDDGGARALLTVPLRKDDALLGLIGIFRQEPGPFSDKQIALLENFAAQAVIAMENARLLGELQERTAELAERNTAFAERIEHQAATIDVLKAMSASPGDPQPVFDLIVRQAREQCNSEIASLFEFDGTMIFCRALISETWSREQVEVYERQFPTPLAGGSLAPSSAILTAIREQRIVHIRDAHARDERISEGARRLGLQSGVMVPLIRDGRAAGAIVLSSKEAGGCSETQVELLKTFAEQAVIAIASAETYRALQARTADLQESLEYQTAISDVLTAISHSTFDAQPVFDTIVATAARLCDSSYANITTRVGEVFRGAAEIGLRSGEASMSDRVFSLNSETVTGRVALAKQVVQVVDIAAEPDYVLTEDARRSGVGTVLGVPMMRGDAVVGTLNLGRRMVRPFTHGQIELVRTFADQAVIAMENARLLSELRESLEQQTATAEVLQVINASPGDLAPVFDAILAKAHTLCHADIGSLGLFDGQYFRKVARQGYNAVAEQFLSQPYAPRDEHKPLLRGQIVHAPDITDYPWETEEARIHTGDWAARSGLRAWLEVPLWKDGRLLGTVSGWRNEPRSFSEKEIALLKSFADQAVIAMENARLLGELQDRTAALALRNSEYGERIEHQAATIDVLKVMSTSPGDPQPVFDQIIQRAKVLCNSTSAGLFEYHDGLMHFRGIRSDLDTSLPALSSYIAQFPMAPTRESMACRAVLDSRTLHVRDMLEEPDLPAATRAMVESGFYRSFLAIPLLRDRQAIGCIWLSAKEAGGYTDSQIALLQTFAEQAAIAITSAETYRALQERTAALAQRNSEFGERIEQQAATIDVLKVMSSTPDDTQPVFDQIVRRAKELCNGNTAALFEMRNGLLHFGAVYSDVDFNTPAMASYIAQYPMAPTRGSVICRTILDSKIIHIKDIQAEPGLPPAVQTLIKDGNYRSQVTIPLMRDGQAIGCISLTAVKPGGFSDSQVSLLQTFAEQAVIAIGSVTTFRALRERTDELARRQNELRVTFENMGDGVAMFDQSQHFVAWNRKFQDLLDVPDDVIARRQSFADYIRYLAERGEYGTDADIDQQVTRLADNVGQSLTLERVRPNGTVIEVRSNPVAGGGFVLIYTDITERKRAEEGLRAARDAAETALRNLELAQASLIQAEKMASLGQLTAGIAHEIKNPLNFVNNFAPLSIELLEELKEVTAPAIATLDGEVRADADDLTETLTSNLRKIEEHGKRADQIVRGMLEHSRGSSGERRAVDLNDLVEEALNLAYHGARAQDQGFNITLERGYGKGIPPLTLAPQDMTRVLLNLFSNGFYAANKRKQAEPGVSPVLRVTTCNAGDAVEIRVRDNGVGVPPEIKDKLFQPFFTTKPTGEGTGLGLSITYDIVTKQHSGTIEVDSEVGKFTEFVVSLPAPVVGNGERA